MSWWAIDVRPDPSRRETRSAPGWWRGPDRRWRSGTTARWSPSPPDERAADALVAELAAAERRGRWRPQRRPLEAVDWSTRWRDGLGPAPVRPAHGRPVLARRSRRSPTRSPSCSIPETAFGSGEHGSTRAALTLLERHLRPGDRVLDLGSGSGILAIAAVKLGAARAVGIENDPEANQVARAERRAQRRGATASSSSRATPATWPRCSVPPTCSSPTSSASVNTALLPAIVAAAPARRPGHLLRHGAAPRRRSSAGADRRGLRLVQEALDAGWWGVAAERP